MPSSQAGWDGVFIQFIFIQVSSFTLSDFYLRINLRKKTAEGRAVDKTVQAESRTSWDQALKVHYGEFWGYLLKEMEYIFRSTVYFIEWIPKYISISV